MLGAPVHPLEYRMRKLFLIACSLGLLWAGPAWAEGPSCLATADGKKLAGPARTSFLNKCERDATTLCDTTATERKLHGAARTSFARKCVKDAVGQAAPAT
jgi:hypothetical protein